ncbi:RNA polymerase B [Neodidymelliopsis sp. IMI 364377]|nr:RNA polymerase B [Neodidymelliopsis sp. IMI 364377]
MDYGESTNPNAARPAPIDYPKPPRLVSRPKPPVAQEEEMGNEIKLGDFEDVHALSVSEARAVVTAVHKGRKNKDPESNPLRDRIHNDNPTITHFLDYFDNFARYKEEESLHAINAMFDTHPELTTVEKALLGTLTPDSADEATTLIPSLADKMDTDSLQAILDELTKMRMSLILHLYLCRTDFSTRGSPAITPGHDPTRLDFTRPSSQQPDA